MGQYCAMSSLERAGRRRPIRFGELGRANREPTTPTMRVVAPLVHRVMRIWTRATWLGGQHIPQSGPAIIVANHISSLDPPLLGEYLAMHGRWPHFLARANLFDGPILGRGLRGVEQIPVLRGSSQARDALRHAERALGRGQVVVLYPEGTITFDPDEWPMAGHTGAARLALRTGAPVIPVGQWGANFALPPRKIHRFRLRRWPITIVAGAPLDLSEFEGDAEDRLVTRAVTNRIMAGITAMAEQARGEAAPPDRWHQRKGYRVPPDQAVI
jgi:1-acyl-sn-glycerol-3-phosphate acyltransferase